MLSDMMPPTFVYVARMGDFVKIGASRDVRKRLRDLEAGRAGTIMPEEVRGLPVSLLATFESGDGLSLERALHDAFAEQRTVGEWFRMDERLTAWCDRRRPGVWWDTDRDHDDAGPPVDF